MIIYNISVGNMLQLYIFHSFKHIILNGQHIILILIISKDD